MAPPTARRTGFSKRAQYGTFFGYIAAIAGAILGAGLLVYALLHKDAFSGPRAVASEVSAPAGEAVAVGRAGVQGFAATVAGYFTLGARHAAMDRELRLARVRLAEARGIADENRRLKALLALREGDERPVASARLITSTASSLRRFATISAGRSEGVAVGMPVRSPFGLVGRVLEVSSHTARVLLITDPESTVPVRRARDGLPAFVQGHADGTLQLRLVTLGVNPLKPGDVFVTSGAGGLYRPGIAVGVVMDLTRDGANARVLSDPTDSEFVAVDPVFAEAAAMPEALAPPPETVLQAPPKMKPKKKKKASA